jgi:hypothetical protein
MDPVTTGLYGVLLPALAAGLVLAAGWRLWRRGAPDGAPTNGGPLEARPADGRWSGGLALAAALWAAQLGLSGPPVAPGGDLTPTGLDWLAWVTLAAAFLLPAEPQLGRRWALLRGALAIVTVELVLRNRFASRWTEGAEAAGWAVGLAALILVEWAALGRLLRAPGARGPLVVWLLAGHLAGIAALTGSVTIGQLAGALAAGAGAALVAAWWRPRVTLAGAGAGLATLALAGLTLNAHFFSYTPGTDALLVAAAPLVGLLGELPPLRRERPWARTLTTAILVSLPLAVALVRALLAFESDPYADYYDY